MVAACEGAIAAGADGVIKMPMVITNIDITNCLSVKVNKRMVWTPYAMAQGIDNTDAAMFVAIILLGRGSLSHTDIKALIYKENMG